MIRWLSRPWRWLRRSDELKRLHDENVRLRLALDVSKIRQHNLEENLGFTLKVMAADRGLKPTP